MNRRVIRSAVSGLLIVVALIVAWMAAMRHRTADTAVADLERKRANLERQIAGTDARRAAIERSASQVRATAQPQASAPGTAAIDDRNDWMRMEKVARSDPKMQAIRAKRMHADLYFQYAGFFHRQGMTSEQIEKFEALKAEHSLNGDDINAAAENMDLGRTDPAISRLRTEEDNRFRASVKDLLGPDGVQQLEAFEQSTSERRAVDRLTAVLSDTANPVSPQQAGQLIDILAVTRVPRPTNRAETQVDWDAVETKASGILSPGQMTEFRSASRLTRRGEAFAQIDDLYRLWRQTK